MCCNKCKGMKALGEYIVIKPEKEEIESGGVILSSKTDKNVRYVKGVVESVGGKVKEVSPGDVVYYDKMATSEMRISGEIKLVLLENGIVVKE